MMKILTKKTRWALYTLLLLVGTISCSKEENTVPGKQAYDFVVNGNMYYAITSDSTVSLTRGTTDFRYTDRLVVPSKVENEGKTYTVTGIDEKCFESCTDLVNVELPQTLKEIGNMAFYGCTGLKSINLPKETLTKIGHTAFANCSNLDSINIPSKITTIEASTFSGCKSLKKVDFPDELEEIGYLSFKDCTGLTSITLNDALTSVNSTAFDGCNSVKVVNFYATALTTTERFLPTSVEEINFLKPGETKTNVSIIPDYAFQGCAVKELTIPRGFLRIIGAHAFENCKNLTKISYRASSLYCLRDYAFAGCEKLDTLQYTDKSGYPVRILPSSLKEYEDKVTDAALGVGVFQGCASLEDISIENSKNITALPENSFLGCVKLNHITLNSTITSIGENCFYGCLVLVGITIPDCLTEISAQAFYNCASLSSVQIGTYTKTTSKDDYGNDVIVYSGNSKLTYIGDMCFYGCAGLTDLAVLTKQVPETGTDLFVSDVNKTGHTLYVLPDLIGDSSNLNSFRGRREWKNWYGMDNPDNFPGIVD